VGRLRRLAAVSIASTSPVRRFPAPSNPNGDVASLQHTIRDPQSLVALTLWIKPDKADENGSTPLLLKPTDGAEP